MECIGAHVDGGRYGQEEDMENIFEVEWLSRY
jgi:hypothetical protein